jgi:hypothetical protein
MQTITFDDLTHEELTNCRIALRILNAKSGFETTYESFVNNEINNYNLGLDSLFIRKPFVPKVIEIKPIELKQPDKFTESSKIIKPIEVVSNIGKKIFIECENEQARIITLVDRDEYAMPELGKITIESDLGRILINARVGDLMDTPLGIIRIVEVVNTLASISKGTSK